MSSILCKVLFMSNTQTLTDLNSVYLRGVTLWIAVLLLTHWFPVRLKRILQMNYFQNFFMLLIFIDSSAMLRELTVQRAKA